MVIEPKRIERVGILLIDFHAPFGTCHGCGRTFTGSGIYCKQCEGYNK
jgi:hypothetical protein